MSYSFLIVDDSNIVRQVLKKTISLSKIPVSKVFEAENGAIALDTLKQEWVDLVFLDINMPIMNGMEFMQRLRVDPDGKQLPVVVVSTEGSKERREQLEKLGISAYLRKPFTPELFASTVEQVLGEVKS